MKFNEEGVESRINMTGHKSNLMKIGNNDDIVIFVNYELHYITSCSHPYYYLLDFYRIWVYSTCFYMNTASYIAIIVSKNCETSIHFNVLLELLSANNFNTHFLEDS